MILGRVSSALCLCVLDFLLINVFLVSNPVRYERMEHAYQGRTFSPFDVLRLRRRSYARRCYALSAIVVRPSTEMKTEETAFWSQKTSREPKYVLRNAKESEETDDRAPRLISVSLLPCALRTKSRKKQAMEPQDLALFLFFHVLCVHAS